MALSAESKKAFDEQKAVYIELVGRIPNAANPKEYKTMPPNKRAVVRSATSVISHLPVLSRAPCR